MKKRYVCFIFLVLIIGLLFCMGGKCQATDLDEIVSYTVTVDPRMNDGSLDITYEIMWKVLDSTTEGPLEWVKIGTPNSNFDTPTALTRNIKSISKYSGSNVKIVFDKKYYAGDVITFKYSIHQSYMYKISGSSCKYEFTPAWFTDCKVKNLAIKWNSDKVTKSDSVSKEDNYLVWRKSNMSKGQKLSINVKYDKSSFSALSTSKQTQSDYSIFLWIGKLFPIIIFVAILILSINSRRRRRLL